jgi:hypothetical protein
VAITLQNYLDLADMGKPPAESGPEEEAEIPAPFQDELRQRRDA